MGTKGHGLRQLQSGTQILQQDRPSAPRNSRLLAVSLCTLLCLASALSGCALTSSGSKPQPESADLNITTSNLSGAQQQASYQAVLTASGGNAPYLWTISSGALPAGLSLTSATGEIAGSATQTGNFKFTIQVQDSSSPLQSATRDYSMAVSNSRSTMAVTTSSMPGGTVGTAYTDGLAVNGGTSPYTWKIASGSLPTGLALASSTGDVAGTPSQQGTSNFTAQVKDSNGLTAEAALSIAVVKAGSSTKSSLTITTTGMPSGAVGTAYGAALATSGGTPPYNWVVFSGSLPAGLSLATSSGTVTGTPSQQGTSNFTVQVMDSNQETAQAALSIGISASGGGKTVGGVALDQYGGREDTPCAQTTSYFHMEKIGSRWWFCDPAGNAYDSMNVSGVTPNGNPTLDCNGKNTYTIYSAKYGDTTYNWGWQTLKRMTSWGFNSVGQDSIGEVQPGQVCSGAGCLWPGGVQPIPVPHIIESKPAEGAAINQAINGVTVLTSAIKDEMSGTNNNYTAWRGGSLYDVFDPSLNAWFQADLQNLHDPTIQQITSNDPYLLGIFTDDSDYFFGSGAGPDFATDGHTNANVAWVTLITAPIQTYIQSTPFGGTTLLYTTSQNFTKTLATNPTTPCSVTNPCSLRDYLWQEYQGNIGSLNKAWGSNYTTFDSSGTNVSAEVVGTGNGTAKAFTHQLAHSALSPFSVLISVGSSPEVGDCPWFHTGCIATTSNMGTLGSPSGLTQQASSTIDYSTGSLTITFKTPPAAGVSIKVSYTYGGWMAGGTGLMDEDGSHSAWVGTNPWCLEGPDPAFSTYFACQGGGGVYQPVPNANANLGADLDNWVPEMAAKYFKTMHDDLKAVSKVPYLGLDTMGSWGAPAYSKFLQGASPYIDGAFVQLLYSAANPSPAFFESGYQYTTKYLGDVPLINFITLLAQPSSSMSCFAATTFENFPTQAARGQEYYNTINYLLTTPGANGTIPFVGFSWWAWRDFQDANQGLVSIHDNAYDGIEDVVSRVPCDSTYSVLNGATCGGESNNYGDIITSIKAANQLWLH